MAPSYWPRSTTASPLHAIAPLLIMRARSARAIAYRELDGAGWPLEDIARFGVGL